jgi:hypothetical protein
MITVTSSALSAWTNFYMIVGSAAAALIGLQFVMIALIVNTQRRSDYDTIHAFLTPTIVQFASALTLAAIMCAPLQSFYATSAAVALCDLGGLIYTAISIRHTRRQTVYKPLLQDWLWYSAFPCVVYAALTVFGLCLIGPVNPALFVIGGSALCLLLIGIRNAWDTVTHMVLTNLHENELKETDL